MQKVQIFMHAGAIRPLILYYMYVSMGDNPLNKPRGLSPCTEAQPKH